MVNIAEQWCLLAAGLYFMAGLITGAWKYHGIRRSPDFKAHPYVSLAHQASLAYAFASLLLSHFARFSPYSPVVTLTAAAVPLAFFGLAIASYVVHGWLRDTDNQFAHPHRLGKRTTHPMATRVFMWSLVAGEIGGSAVLVWGFVQSQVLAAG